MLASTAGPASIAPAEEERTGSVVRVWLQAHQAEAFSAPEPFVCLLTGLGGGKTWLGARWLVLRAVAWPRSVHLATGNSLEQCRDVVTPELLRACDEMGIRYVWHKTERRLLLPGGASIWVKSTANYQLLRGPAYGSWWADELRDCPREAYGIIAGRLRCRKVDRPRYLATTTPNGFDYIYERHAVLGDPRYRLVQAPSTVNRYLSPEYVETLRAMYDDTLVQQEIEGKFVALGAGVVYRAFNRATNVKPASYDPSKRLYLGVDFNWNPLVLTVSQWHEDLEKRGSPRHGEIHVIDEAWCRHSSIHDGVGRLAAKWAQHPGGWDVWPDPAGKGHNHAGYTDHQLLSLALEAHRFTKVTMIQGRAAPGTRDGVNAVNALLRNGLGVSRLFIDPHCTHLIDDLERCVWEDEQALAVDKSDPNRTHCADSIKYWAFGVHGPNAFERESGWKSGARRG